MADLYRKSSLERLSNPEQLDKAIVVTSKMSWLALVGVTIVIISTIIWAFKGTLPTTETVAGIIVGPESVGAIYSDYVGSIYNVAKKEGDQVKEGQLVAQVKLLDGTVENIRAKSDFVISAMLISKGDNVYRGSEIARYTPSEESSQILLCYVPTSKVNGFEVDMRALVYPTSVDTSRYGHMEASIERIGEYAVNTSNMWYVLGTDNLVSNQFVSNGPVTAVACKLKVDSNTKSGYFWSSNKGKELVVENQTYATVKIVTDECAPITKLIGILREKIGD